MPIKKKRCLTIAMYTENHKQSRLAKSKTSRIQKQNKSINTTIKKEKENKIKGAMTLLKRERHDA